MPSGSRPRSRPRVLFLLSIGEQIGISNSCDFRMETAFPPTDSFPESEHVRNLCKLATEANRMMESDKTAIDEAENDAKAIIDDWKRMDSSLEEISAKIHDIRLEHTSSTTHVDRVISSIASLRDHLSGEASKKASRRCWENETRMSRYRYMKNNTAAAPLEEDTSSQSLCKICHEKSIEIAFSPCGHVFCQSCASRNDGSCYVCRAFIRNELRLYGM